MPHPPDPEDIIITANPGDGSNEEAEGESPQSGLTNENTEQMQGEVPDNEDHATTTVEQQGNSD